ncbi:MAG: DUF885 domain-containing protein [Pseudomonadota bacterium]
MPDVRVPTIGAIMMLTACGAQESETPAVDDETSSAPAVELHAIADEYLAATIQQSPFSATFAGLGDVIEQSQSAFNDISPDARAAFEAAEDSLLGRINNIDADQFEGADWALYETLREAMQASAETRVCDQHLWSLNHMFGWQNAFPIIAAAQPVESNEDRAMALERWAKLPAFLAQDRSNLEDGLSQGFSAPKRVTARVIAQLDSLLERPADQSPFIAFAANSEDQAFREAAGNLVSDKINPAIAAYRDYLREEYLPRARDALAITALPNGAACYEAMLRGYHTAAIGAEETYRRGRETVDGHVQSVIDRGEAMFGVTDFAEILRRVKEDPENRFESESQLLEETRALIPVTKEKVAPFFSSLPEQELIVEPYPDYLKGTGQSSRYEQKPLAEGAATYRINTDDWRYDTRGGAEIVAVHEGWPGHHLQISTAHGLGDLHPVMKLLRSTAYVEGWARYSEALAEEAGVYESGFGEITRRAWPARGMVVDPGLHLYGWTNEQAKSFVRESGRFESEEAGENLLDRLAVIPGQLTAYDTGGLEIFALRSEAEERLGESFDIRAFHDRILENGALPLGALRAHVRAWISEEEERLTQ